MYHEIDEEVLVSGLFTIEDLRKSMEIEKLGHCIRIMKAIGDLPGEDGHMNGLVLDVDGGVSSTDVIGEDIAIESPSAVVGIIAADLEVPIMEYEQLSPQHRINEEWQKKQRDNLYRIRGMPLNVLGK